MRGLAHQIGGRQSANLARRRTTVADFTLRHDHCNVIALDRLALRLQIVLEADLAEGLVLIVLAHLLLQRLAQGLIGLQAVYPAPIFGQLPCIALGSLQSTRERINIFCNAAQRQFARSLNTCGVQAPQRIEHISLCLQRRTRRCFQHKGLPRRFVLTHAYQIGFNAQPIQGLLVVIAPAAQAFNINRAHGMQHHLARMGGQVILALVVGGRPRDHRFARGLEPFKGRSGLAQGHQAATFEVIELEQHALNALVLGRQIEHLHQVTQAHRFSGLTLQLSYYLVAQTSFRFFNQGALQGQYQHRMLLDLDLAGNKHPPDHGSGIKQNGQHQQNTQALRGPVRHFGKNPADGLVGRLELVEHGEHSLCVVLKNSIPHALPAPVHGFFIVFTCNRHSVFIAWDRYVVFLKNITFFAPQRCDPAHTLQTRKPSCPEILAFSQTCKILRRLPGAIV